MRRFGKIVLWVVLGLILVLALCGIVFATFDWNHARPWVSKRVSQLADRPVVIQGDLDIDWLQPGDAAEGWRGWVPWPQITAHNVQVGNAPWSKHDGGMADVSSLSAVINPLALLSHTVEIASLEVEDADLYLERNAEGENNWTFGKKDNKDESPSWKVNLQSLSLQSVHARLVDTSSKLDMNAELDTVDNDQHYGLAWKANGVYNDAKISGEGKAGSILTFGQSTEPFPLQGKLSIGTTVIEVEGSATQPKALAALDVQLKLAGDSMSDLLPLFGVALPQTPPYNTAGRLTATLGDNEDVWHYDDFDGKVGQSDVHGSLVYTRRAPRPILTGSVTSDQLRLKDLGPLIGLDTSDVESKAAKESAKGQPADKVFPVQPINTKAWGVMDADVQFKGKRILRNKDLPLDNVQAHVVLKDKVLSLEPLNFGMAGGTLANTLVLDGSGSKIAARLDTEARHMKLKKLFPGAESMDASFGELHGQAKLTGQGVSIAEILGHSNGHLQALVSRGTISQYLLEAAGLNLANMIILKLFGDDQIVLNCMASDFDVKNGLMQTEAFRLETDDTIVDITGTINLATEKIDMKIVPANKTLRVFTLRSPLYARGTLKHPDVGVEKGPLALRAGAAIALGVIATPFAALLPLLNMGTNESSGCVSLGQGEAKGGSSKQAKESAEERQKRAERKERQSWPSSQAKP
ncbi:AsmA family protein [Alcaligenaceae bacterium]|nr:AsmA family protein [Alcaligenaceae bacterium]